MEHSRRTPSRSRGLVVAALLASAASFAAREPLAQSVEELQGNPTERLITPRAARPHGKLRGRASLARATTGPDRGAKKLTLLR
jgi:hypothetical protein